MVKLKNKIKLINSLPEDENNSEFMQQKMYRIYMCNIIKRHKGYIQKR